jgi:hypothetical protein
MLAVKGVQHEGERVAVLQEIERLLPLLIGNRLDCRSRLGRWRRCV